MARATTCIQILTGFGQITLLFVAVLYPIATGPRSDFQETPRSVSEYAGVDVEFRCRHPQVDHFGWRLNATFIGMLTSSVILKDHCNFTQSVILITLSDNSNVTVGVLRIRAAIECNGTQVECVIFDDQGLILGYSDNATLTVRRPDAVKNLTVLVDSNTLSISISWSPIPEPIDMMPLISQTFVRITYQVNITQSDDFMSVINSSETNDTRITFIPRDPSPCYYYNITVISIINFKYSGIKIVREQIYLYEDLPSIISVLDYNSTVIQSYKIQYTFSLSVSLYACRVFLNLRSEGEDYPAIRSEEVPGMISEVTFVINQTLLDKGYYNATISISNALHTVSVPAPSLLSTYDVQDLTVQNDSLIVTFLEGSTAKGAFIILAISETMGPVPNFTFGYVPVEKSPSSNNISIEISTLLRTVTDSVIIKSNSSMSTVTVLVYDIENTGLMKDSMNLMPVKLLTLNHSTSALLTDDGNHNHYEMNNIATGSDSESDWGSVQAYSTSHSIKIVCEIFKPEAININGCSAIVHDQLSIPYNEFTLAVNNSDNGGLVHTLEFKVEIQNRGNVYNYVVFPITSKGIVGSSGVKGIVHITNDSETIITETGCTPKNVDRNPAIYYISLPIVAAVILIIGLASLTIICICRRKDGIGKGGVCQNATNQSLTNSDSENEEIQEHDQGRERPMQSIMEVEDIDDSDHESDTATEKDVTTIL